MANKETKQSRHRQQLVHIHRGFQLKTSHLYQDSSQSILQQESLQVTTLQARHCQSLKMCRHFSREWYDDGRVTKTTVLLADIAEFAEMNQVYAEFFAEPFPARAAFEVAAFTKKCES